MSRLSRSSGPETALWRAVVLQALLDASGRGYVEGGRSRETTEAQRRAHAFDALQWSDGPDVVRVCELADLDPSQVRRRIREMSAQTEAKDG